MQDAKRSVTAVFCPNQQAVRHRGVSGLSFSVRSVFPETIRGLLP